MPPPGVCLDMIRDRNEAEGIGTRDNPAKFRGQDFYRLRKEFLERRRTFLDAAFPPTDSSIGPLLPPEKMSKVVWNRPKKIVQNPQFIVDGVSRFDFAQGELGDCWFLAAIGALTFQDYMLKEVIPTDQGFHTDYAGIFHFRFWRFGRWVDVVIDDKLPTINGKLIFVREKTANEFWAALLEKAYAKVCGSYANMKGGSVSEAMMDFTGGVNVMFKLKEAPPDLWELMYRATKFKSLIGCGTPAGANNRDTELPNGLVQGHAYAVTGVKQVTSRGKPKKLVRLWNPWGKWEWKGNWSDKSSLWETVSVEERMSSLQISDDGEFWMSMEDFRRNFHELSICCLSPNFLDESPCQWASSVHLGRWVVGATAGGCIKHPETFWMNPQYEVKVTTDRGGNDHQGPYNMLVTLMQKSDKDIRSLASLHHIGFSVFAVPPEFQASRRKLPQSFFNTTPVAQTRSFLNVREITECFHLHPGEYVIVPTTFNPNESAFFALRIFSRMETCVGETSARHPMTINRVIPFEYDSSEDTTVFAQYADQYKELDAEQLQRLLNENVVKGGFELETCRSIVAMMDLSVTGRLNNAEFERLWKRVLTYKTIFFKTDVSGTGRLHLHELRNAIEATGITVSDSLLNLLALRFGSSSQDITLENFIYLMLRLDCMNKIFKNLSDKKGIYLKEKEWLFLSMYS